MTIIIDNIITPYEIARYNEIHNIWKGDFEVWFKEKLKETRLRSREPKIFFKHRFLTNKFEIITLLDKNKNQIKRIICCGWDNSVYLYALIFCKKNGIRFTLWSGSTVYENSFLRQFFSPLIKLFVAYSNDYIAYGSRAQEYLVRLGAKKEKIKVVLNTVDVKYFHLKAIMLKKIKSILLDKYGLPKDGIVFAYVGQLIERKGIRELLRGFGLASLRYKNISLMMAGDGVLKKEIRDFIKNNPEVKIRLLGYLDYQSLPEVYAISDALILPSKQEVWGLVVNEALASNIPVLVSRYVGSCDDLINDDNGEIIHEISPEGIFDAISRYFKKRKYFISSEILTKMSIKSYAKEI